MTSENDIREPDDVLAAEYVLGVLPHAERVAFTARLSGDAELQSRVQFWETHFSVIAEEVEPVTPPAHVQVGIESKLFASSAGTPDGPVSWWSSLGFWRGLSGVSLAALVVLAGLYGGIIGSPEESGKTQHVFVAELSGEDGAVELLALYDARSGVLKINRLKGTPAPGRSFELWLIEGGNDPVSLGLVPTSVRGEVTVPETLRRKFDGAIVAISDEPEGGSPTGKATGPVLAAGKAVEI